MKKLKYIMLLTFSIGLFSCSEDDSYSIAYVDDEVKTPLTGSLAISTANIFNSNMVDLNYTLPQTFDAESVVEITLTSTFGALSIKPNTEILVDTIPSGTSTGTVTFEMPNYDNVAPFMGISDFLSANITGIKLVQPEEGSIDDPYTMTSDSVSLNLFEFHDPYMLPNPETLMISLDWEGPWDVNDLDMYVIDAGFTMTFETAESGDRFEGDFFNNPANEEHPDGDYIIETAIWTSADDTTPIPSRLVLTHPDGSVDTYEFSVDPAVGFIDSVGFTKTTDGDGNVTFDTYTLP